MRAWLPLLVALLGCEGAKKPFTCSSYDDDGKYDAYECSSYDVDACEVQCRNGTLCDRLCGAGNVSCATGGGAVCAMRVLSDIDAVCASLAGGRGEPASAARPTRGAPPAAAAAARRAAARRRTRRSRTRARAATTTCTASTSGGRAAALVAPASRYVSVTDRRADRDGAAARLDVAQPLGVVRRGRRRRDDLERLAATAWARAAAARPARAGSATGAAGSLADARVREARAPPTSSSWSPPSRSSPGSGC